MSLCEIPPPSEELLTKYEGMRDTFKRRLDKAVENLRLTFAPYMAELDTEGTTQVKAYLDNVQAMPEFQGTMKMLTALKDGVLTYARTNVLGLYEQKLRPHVGQDLSKAIDDIKVYLDKYLPSE